MLIIILFLAITVILFIFSSKTLSPIPYFPSQSVDIPLIIKALELKDDQTVIDLGAGDGIVIFKAAGKAFQQKLNTQFIAVEINPVLVLVLHLKRILHPNRKNIKIIHDDIFKMNFDFLAVKQWNNVTIYLYISPWYLERTIKNLKLKIKNFSVISYMYPVKSMKRTERFIQGKNKIFIY